MTKTSFTRTTLSMTALEYKYNYRAERLPSAPPLVKTLGGYDTSKLPVRA